MIPDGTKARHYAWLLRGDVRQATRSQAGPNEAFEGWWLACGRKEFPAFSTLEPHQAQWLRAPVGTLDVGGMGSLPVPRAMQLVLQYRPDVRQSLGQDPLALAAWFLANGLVEHDLLGLVDEDWVRALDQRARVGDAGTPATGEQPPAPTLLMALVWHLLPKEQRAAQALGDAQGRWRFLGSFFGAVARSCALQGLLAPRWRVWLCQAVWPMARTPEGQRLQPRWQTLGLAAPAVAWLDDRPAAPLQGRVGPPSIAADDWRLRPFGVNLYGFAFGELGIGEDVRMAAQACEAAGLPYRVINVDPGPQLRQADRVLAGKVAQADDQAPYAFNVFCMPGFDMLGRVVMRQGPQLLQGHCNIGWWPWELPVWPQRWRSAFDLVDEVWASSTFTQATYAGATRKPVVRMPLAVSVDRMRPVARGALGLPARRFLFLFIFDANSFLPRKNPQAVVQAFQHAFPAKDKTVGLVVKAMNGRPGHPVWDDFTALCRQDGRIVLLEQTMDREDVLGLVNACDAYVSLHRAEGFGRTLAEAMLLGKPVVATDFSGNADFLSAEVGFPVRWHRREVQPGEYLFVEPDDHAWWADADVEDAARQMRAALAGARQPAFAEGVRRHAAHAFSAQRVGQQMRQRLEALWHAGGAAAAAPPPGATFAALRVAGLTSVVIPVLDHPKLTSECLASVLSEAAGTALEVVVVDNGSAAPTQRVLQAWQARHPDVVRVVRLASNLGFGRGCNHGFEASRGEFVVFLNNDTTVTAGWLAALVQPLQADPRVAAVQPKILHPDGKLQCAGVVFSAQGVLGYPLYAGVPGDADCANRPRDVRAVTAACMALRADDFARLGGFDAAFQNGQEDVDLCLRLVGPDGAPEPARVCRYEPRACIVHHESRTPGRHAHLRDNRLAFVRRWQGRVRPDDLDHYAADGFEVTRYVQDNADNARLGIAVSRPVLRRRPG